MQSLIVGGLLCVVADKRNVSGSHLHCASSFGGDFDLSIAGGYGTDIGLLVRGGDVQLFIGGDLRDRIELQRNVSRELRVQDQRLAIGLHDLAAQVIPVFQSDLIGEHCRRNSQQHDESDKLILTQHCLPPNSRVKSQSSDAGLPVKDGKCKAAATSGEANVSERIFG